MESARGADDETILQFANSDEPILLTVDKDFGELVIRQGLPALGVVLFRINSADTATKWVRFREVIPHYSIRPGGSFVVMDESKKRIRPLRSSMTQLETDDPNVSDFALSRTNYLYWPLESFLWMEGPRMASISF